MTAYIQSKILPLFLFIIWWAANNIYAIDSERFFNRFPSRWHAVDHVFTQSLVGLAIMSLMQLMRSFQADDSSNEAATETTTESVPDKRHFRVSIFAAIGAVHCAGSLLTTMSYASVGAASTLLWKLTESFSAALFKVCILRVSVPLPSMLAVTAVLSGVITFSAQSFRVASYMPIITSNLIFPLRNTLLKLGQNPADSREQRYSYMLLFGLPFSFIAMAVRLTAAPFQVTAIPYLIRNALYFNTYQYTSVSLLAIFDTVAHALLNTFKRFSAIIVTMVVLQTDLKMEHYVGITLSLLGFVAYTVSQQVFAPKLASGLNSCLLTYKFPVLLLLIAIPFINLTNISSISAYARTTRELSEPFDNDAVGFTFSHLRAHPYTVQNTSGDLDHAKLNTWQLSAYDQIVKFPRKGLLVCKGPSECRAVLNSKRRLSVVMHFHLDNSVTDDIGQRLDEIVGYAKNRAVARVIVDGVGVKWPLQADKETDESRLARHTMSTDKTTPLSKRTRTTLRLMNKLPVDMLVQGDVSRDELRAGGYRYALSTGSVSFWRSDDARLGRTLETRYRTLSGRVGDPSVKVAVVGNLCGRYREVVTGIAKWYPQAAFYVWMDADAVNLETCHITSTRYRILKSVDACVDSLRSMDVVLSSLTEGALMAMEAGVPSLIIAGNYAVLEMAQRMKIPHVVPSALPETGVDIAKLVQGARFDGDAFDINRCQIAKMYRSVYRRVALNVTSIVQALSEYC